MRLLYVDDDKITASFVKRSLKEVGFVVDVAYSGKEGLSLAQVNKGEYDLIILDVLLPEIDGLKICTTIREGGDRTPILFLSSRDAIENKVEGLNLGADDYLTKPFDVSELIARANALIRRSTRIDSTVLSIGNITIDDVAHEVTVSEKMINLTQVEYRLLKLLVSNKGKLVTRSIIVEKVWDMHGGDMMSNSINVHIRRLRKKLGDKSQKSLIKTIRGAGYKISEK